MYKMLLIAVLMSGCANIVVPPPVGREGGWWCDSYSQDTDYHRCSRTVSCEFCGWQNTVYCFAYQTPDDVRCFSDQQTCEQNIGGLSTVSDCTEEH